jgi:hypothetical protein
VVGSALGCGLFYPGGGRAMMVSRRAGSCLLACLASVLGVTTLAASEPSGVAVAVIQSADVDGATGKLVIQPEGPLYSGDRINTGAIGEVQVRFRDNRSAPQDFCHFGLQKTLLLNNYWGAPAMHCRCL